MISPWSHSRLELNRPVAPKDSGPPSPRVPKFVSPAHALSPKSAWSSAASSYLRRKWLFSRCKYHPSLGSVAKKNISDQKNAATWGDSPKLLQRYTFRSKLWPLQFCPVAPGGDNSQPLLLLCPKSWPWRAIFDVVLYRHYFYVYVGTYHIFML